ncbi:MAG: homocitrate synthase/isopropylmalate synthase family protein, partial [Terriglobales bacterium]
VGVPDSTLVLGKHSGRHALGLRCEQLGYTFDLRELDEIYRQFVVLADEIKHVHDHHLLDLIRETRGIRQAPALAAAASIGTPRKPFPAPLPSDYSAATLPRNTLTEHHSEQEDYLWGV